MYECKIAEKLVELRNARGVTQEDVAQSLSISNKTVSKWENGASTPDLPMVVELAKYYGVTTDTLLGLSEDKKQSTTEEIRSLFEGLDRRESVLKAFETIRALVPSMYGTISKYYDDAYDKENVYPTGTSHGYRSAISLHEFFEFTASSENVNLAVMMLRNKANFVWMSDVNKQKEIVKIFNALELKLNVGIFCKASMYEPFTVVDDEVHTVFACFTVGIETAYLNNSLNILELFLKRGNIICNNLYKRQSCIKEYFI